MFDIDNALKKDLSPHTTIPKRSYPMKILPVLLILTTLSLQARVNCAQFADHAEAQRYYEARQHGWKSLDRDHDGEACECLPGGSASGSSVCRRWQRKYGI